MFISRHIAVLLWTVDVVNVGYLGTVCNNGKISDDLILTLRCFDVSLLELPLSHCSHLHCCDLVGKTRVHVEVLIEFLVRRKEGVQIPT